MHFIALLLACFSLLAGRVYAQQYPLNITLDTGKHGGLVNVTASQFIMANDTDLSTKCQSNCTNAISAITACSNFNATCLCSDTTLNFTLQCQQCYFDTLIQENRRMPNIVAGNQNALTAFANACNSSLDVMPAANLTTLIAEPFTGSFGESLDTGGLVVGIAATIFLGVGAITVVNTM